MKDPCAIREAFESLGIRVSDDESKRLTGPLRPILVDPQKIDALEDSLGTPAPFFHMEPDMESNND